MGATRQGRVLLTGGGSGGHIFPALAVGDELARRGYEITYAGSGSGPEARLVPERGIPFHPLPARPLLGRGVVGKARALATLAGGGWAGRRLVRELGAQVVVGTGGYVSAPAVVGARLAGRPVYLLEPNARPGFANRQLSRFAREAAIAFPEAARGLACPSEVTGVPVRRAFAEVADVRTGGDGARTGRHLLVLGGSQGALVVNQALPAVAVEATAALEAAGAGPLTIHHQTGANHFEATHELYERAGFPGERLRLEPFVDDVAGAMAAADLVVSRAGAITVSEIATAGRPAILVPLALAEGHQGDNARSLEAAGAARVVEQGEGMAEALLAALVDLFRSPSELAAMGRAARAWSRPDAAATIAERVARLVAGEER